MGRCNEILSDWISRYPGQWMWLSRRWASTERIFHDPRHRSGQGENGMGRREEEGSLLLSGIFPTAEGDLFFRGMEQRSPEMIEPFVIEGRAADMEAVRLSECVVGSGTGRNLLYSLAQTLSLRVQLVPEKGTTLLSRDLYWKIHPPKGVQRILPASLRVPPRDLDDLAAWAIVLRYLELRNTNREEGEKENGN